MAHLRLLSLPPLGGASIQLSPWPGSGKNTNLCNLKFWVDSSGTLQRQKINSKEVTRKINNRLRCERNLILVAAIVFEL